MNLSNSHAAPRGAHPTASAATTPASGSTAEGHGPMSTPARLGWDPFEVWRTRVRDARRDVAPARAG